MAVSVRKLREAVLQLLYCKEVSGSDEEGVSSFMMEELEISKRTVLNALERVNEVMAKHEEIDASIAEISEEYQFERIQRVERSILRLGVYELLYDEEIPAKVAIAEALRLSRKFSTPEAVSFINALLDNIYKQSLGEVTDKGKISEALKVLLDSQRLAQEAARQEKKDEDKVDF